MKINKLPVIWYLPNKKKPFTSSTVATNDLIVMLSEKYQTIKDVYEAINYDNEAKDILLNFIKNGYKDYIAFDFFHINRELKYRKLEKGKIKVFTLKEMLKEIKTNGR